MHCSKLILALACLTIAADLSFAKPTTAEDVSKNELETTLGVGQDAAVQENKDDSRESRMWAPWTYANSVSRGRFNVGQSSSNTNKPKKTGLKRTSQQTRSSSQSSDDDSFSGYDHPYNYGPYGYYPNSYYYYGPYGYY